MSSLKSAMKGHQKTHRERGQVSGRKHLGLLEKRKDYVKRAKNYHQKEAFLKSLKKKAVEKNPDEFYFKMISSKTRDGVHIQPRGTATYTKDQIDLMKTQDVAYLNLQRSREFSKIEKLEKNLQFIGEADKQSRSHVFFVDTKEEEKKFDAAAQLNTVPDLLTRAHNRPTVDMLRENNFAVEVEDKDRNATYKELQARVERNSSLEKSVQGLKLQRQLMGKGTVKKKKNNGKSTYKWKKIRKR